MWSSCRFTHFYAGGGYICLPYPSPNPFLTLNIWTTTTRHHFNALQQSYYAHCVHQYQYLLEYFWYILSQTLSASSPRVTFKWWPFFLWNAVNHYKRTFTFFILNLPTIYFTFPTAMHEPSLSLTQFYIQLRSFLKF